MTPPEPQVSEDEIVRQLSLRRFDPVTGVVYHLEDNPPETDEIAERHPTRALPCAALTPVVAALQADPASR